MSSTLDFGYPWWLSYGHVVVLLPALAGLAAGRLRRWPNGRMVVLGLIALWAVGGLLVMRSFGANRRADPPPANFLASGKGKVLDIGAGTGRSSLMVLEARPQATLVAFDLFGDSFSHHFGPGSSMGPQERLRANLRAAGVEERVTVETGDMRQLPFAAASFDAIVSAYAIDHLRADGIRQTLAEAARVVKPGGDFLLILVSNDARVKFALGPLLSHGGLRPDSWWAEEVAKTGFQIAERGTSTGTRYLLLRRPA